jgi:hypothetical protein
VARVALDGDGAAVLLRQRAGDWEAKPCTLPVAGTIGSVEPLKDVRKVCRINANESERL